MAAHPFDTLRPEYERELAAMRVTRPQAVEAAARSVLRLDDHYKELSRRTGVPAALLGAIDYREDDNDPSRGIGQGDRWDRRSVNVPAGKGPFKSKLEADVFYVNYDHLNDNSAPWTEAYACWKGEAWNGFGYRAHGVRTPYLWGSTNLQQPGRYVRDGKFDSSQMDSQVGIVPVWRRVIELDPSMAFGSPIPQQPEPVPPIDRKTHV